MPSLPSPDDTRETILAATLARLEAERLAPPPTPHPTTREVAERHAAGLDEHGYQRPPLLAADADKLRVRHLRRIA